MTIFAYRTNDGRRRQARYLLGLCGLLLAGCQGPIAPSSHLPDRSESERGEQAVLEVKAAPTVDANHGESEDHVGQAAVGEGAATIRVISPIEEGPIDDLLKPHDGSGTVIKGLR